MRFIERYGYLIIIVTVGLILLMAIPISVNMLAKNSIFQDTAGEFNSWLGFWGSFFGGIISGVITLGGVFLALHHERSYSLFTRYTTKKIAYERFEDWITDIQNVINYITPLTGKESSIFIKTANNIKNQTKTILIEISNVDLELYILGRKLENEFSMLVINYGQYNGDDEYNKKHAEKYLSENIIEINKVATEIEKRSKIINKIVSKF